MAQKKQKSIFFFHKLFRYVPESRFSSYNNPEVFAYLWNDLEKGKTIHLGLFLQSQVKI